jgi:hypothetical protein
MHAAARHAESDRRRSGAGRAAPAQQRSIQRQTQLQRSGGARRWKIAIRSLPSVRQFISVSLMLGLWGAARSLHPDRPHCLPPHVEGFPRSHAGPRFLPLRSTSYDESASRQASAVSRSRHACMVMTVVSRRHPGWHEDSARGQGCTVLAKCSLDSVCAEKSRWPSTAVSRFSRRRACSERMLLSEDLCRF